MIGVAAGAMAVSGISAASENASPGDALYGVKRSTERAQLAMAGSDVTRGQLSLDFARTRLAEAAAMAGDDPEFAGVLDDMDTDTRKGVVLLTTSAVARRDTKPLATRRHVRRPASGRRSMPVLDSLSAANRERALTSIGLLDSVGRAGRRPACGLNCSSLASIGLGHARAEAARLHRRARQRHDRRVARPGAAASRTGKSTEESPVRPSPARPSPAGDLGTGVERRSLRPAPAAHRQVAPSRSPGAPPTTPGDSGDGDVLGGLLGGILGGN